MVNSGIAQAILRDKYLIDFNNLVSYPSRTGIQRVCYEFATRWPHIDQTIPFIQCGSDKIGLLDPDFFEYLRQYFEEEDAVLSALSKNKEVIIPEISPGWIGIISARNRIVCEMSVADALKHCRCVISLEESLNLDFYSLAAKNYPDKIFNLCHDFLSWTNPDQFRIDWRQADNVSLSLSNRRRYRNNFFTSTAMRDVYVNRINRGDKRDYAVIPPGADGMGRTFRHRAPISMEFVVVGTLEPRKQPLRILDAFILLNNQENEVRLCFAGRMGWLKEEDENRLRGAIKTYPWLRWLDSPTDSELRDLVAQARATIYLSLAEGFGSPPVESLALGVPCIVSAVIPSVLDMASNGQIRIAPEDTNALVTAIQRLMDDREVEALQRQIKTLALPTWKGFVDGIAALIERESTPAASLDGLSPGYRMILAEIQVLSCLWELDRSNLIRSLCKATGSSWGEREIEGWVEEARRAGWTNVDVTLKIMNALPRGRLPSSLVSAAIDKELPIQVHTVPGDFASAWQKQIRSLLTIEPAAEFESAIYREIHKREPGATELQRA
jgi:glycosyltransferase involved in cell wall biosynthesis